MDENFSQYLSDLLSELRRRARPDFTGVGLIFYSGPATFLPIHAMGDESIFRPRLPIRGKDLIAATLSEISHQASPWHDGFHLVEADKFELTHICQFILPSTDLIDPPSIGSLPVGACAKAAMAVSRMPNVFCSIQMRSDLTQRIFSEGKLIIL